MKDASGLIGHAECNEKHAGARIVLTGGPGAGKTAALELARRSFCEHVKVLPEAAGIIFAGGFPRGTEAAARRAAQRAIYHVQRELENIADSLDAALVICDRGTVDGVAYWPGPGDLFASVNSTIEAELARYDAVIHLRTPHTGNGYNLSNPLRVETADEARAIDDRIASAWSAHPRRFVVNSATEFVTKAVAVLELIQALVPECCRAHSRLPKPPST